MKQQNLLYKNVITDCIVIARQHVIFNNKPFVAFMYSNCYGYNKLGMVIWAVYGNHNKNKNSQDHNNKKKASIPCLINAIIEPMMEIPIPITPML